MRMDGLLIQLTKAVLERALAEELTEHLGYDKHGSAELGSGSSRNGTTANCTGKSWGSSELGDTSRTSRASRPVLWTPEMRLHRLFDRQSRAPSWQGAG